MFNIGPAELMVVLLVALLVLGPNKLPDAARQVGRAIGEIRKLSSGFQAEMRDALKEPVEGKPTTSGTKPANASGVLASPKVDGSDAEVALSGNGTSPPDDSVPPEEPTAPETITPEADDPTEPTVAGPEASLPVAEEPTAAIGEAAAVPDPDTAATPGDHGPPAG